MKTVENEPLQKELDALNVAGLSLYNK